MSKYRLEIFKDNEWALVGFYNDYKSVIVASNVIHKTKKCDVRIIHNGLIIYFKEGE